MAKNESSIWKVDVVPFQDRHEIEITCSDAGRYIGNHVAGLLVERFSAVCAAPQFGPYWILRDVHVRGASFKLVEDVPEWCPLKLVSERPSDDAVLTVLAVELEQALNEDRRS